MTPNDISAWRSAMRDFDLKSLPTSGRFERWLTRMLRQDPDPSFRFRCAYFAANSHRSAMTSALALVAKDRSEHHVVRARCLESLAHKASWYKPKTRQDRKVHAVVLGCLRDVHPNVRFWACFAAAGMRLLSAQSVLRELTEDNGLGCMGWTVSYEAGEALKVINDQPGWAQEISPGTNPYPNLL